MQNLPRGSGSSSNSSSASHSSLDRMTGRDTSTTIKAVNDVTGHVRIGDLLMGAGIVADEFIKSALASFEDQGMPLGKILTMSGYLTEPQLRRALEIQFLVNDRRLPIDIAVMVLSLAHRDGLTLAEAFERSNVVQPDDLLSNKLGQLLIGAGVISQPMLDEALTVSQSSGLPLGHIFCYQGSISQQLLETALLGQQLVRRGSLSRESCVAAIAKAHNREINLEQLPVNSGFERVMTRQTPRLGELVFAGEFIADSELITALQLSLSNGISSGAAMVSCAHLPSEVVLACVELQEMIDNQLLDTSLAYETLFKMKEFGYSFERSLGEACTHGPLLNQMTLFVDLLSLAGRLAAAVADLPPEIHERLALNYNQAKDITRLLLDGNFTDEHSAYCALRLVHLIYLEKIDFEQAVAALQIACSVPLFVDEALYRLKLKKRTRLREPL